MRRNSYLASPVLFAISMLLTATVGIRGAFADGTVTGQVADEQGQVLPGANVEVLGINMGATADDEGNYSIANVPRGTYSLRASLIGYGQKTMKDVEVADGDATVDFSLHERPIPLSSTAPPSELLCSSSSLTKSGFAARSGNKTVCAVESWSTRRPFLCGNASATRF